jgi:predicted nucleic acid-binding protein
VPERLLLDTDVLIDYLRGVPEAVTFLDNLENPLLISAIAVAELYAGVRPGKETQLLHQFLTAFEIIPVDQEIARQGGLYRGNYGPSHNTGLADALIAATAELAQATLVTLNTTHFPSVKVQVPYRKS